MSEVKVNVKAKTILVDDMTCVNCERKIENKLKKTRGVIEAKASFTDGSIQVTYDADAIGINDMEKIIEALGYRITKEMYRLSVTNFVASAAALFVLYMTLVHFELLSFFYDFPEAKEGMGYGMLFVVGLLTSVHCIGMCGGINLSASLPGSTSSSSIPKALRKFFGENSAARFAAVRSGLLYNMSRVVSYTLIGGAIGALGAAAAPSEKFKTGIQIVAGVFMVIMGLNMLNIFPSLRRFNLHMPKFFAGKIHSGKHNGPIYVGLLNGFMPCGPLQAMQLYALGTGSFVKGALSMFFFSAGTLPLTFGLSALSSILTKKFTRAAMTVGAAMVILMGVAMFGNGMNLAGGFSTVYPQNDVVADVIAPIPENKVQLIRTELKPYQYDPIKVQVGIPVRWTIYAEPGTLNGCNYRLVIPEFGRLQKQLALGENIVEFTPAKAGTFIYTCWMGMIRGSITVTEEDSMSAPIS